MKTAECKRVSSPWPEAAAYFQLFLQTRPDDPRVPYVLYDLGQTYESDGELNLAIPAYAQFIEAADPNSAIALNLIERFPQLAPEGGEPK